MFYEEHRGKRSIARQVGVSRNFVRRWTQQPGQDCSLDRRGWPRGYRRKWSKDTERRVRCLYRRLQRDPQRFYISATVISQEWRRYYPDVVIPPLRTLGRLLKELGLSRGRRHGKNRGAARYLCYPEHTVYHRFGGRLLEVDFIGEKYLRGHSEPLNFLGFSFKKVPRLRYFLRVSGQGATDIIQGCQDFFARYEQPDYVKVDNGPATIGSGSGCRTISQVMAYLLQLGIVPIYAVPRKPFSQASIEGNNSVFARVFWNRHEFRSLADVDQQLGWFNEDSKRYTGYTAPNQAVRKHDFKPRVYFIRQVREAQDQTGYIEVLHESINLPRSYVNYFVLAEWCLRDEILNVYFERDLEPELIKQVTFKINERSRKKWSPLL